MTNYEKLVETLRWTANEYKGSIMDEDDKDTINAAADAIEALEKQIDSIENDKTNLEADIINLEIAIDKANTQLPKRGEWIKHPEVKNIYGGEYIECPFCGEKYVVQYIADEKFCRNCGADMRAKMEVQG